MVISGFIRNTEGGEEISVCQKKKGKISRKGGFNFKLLCDYYECKCKCKVRENKIYSQVVSASSRNADAKLLKYRLLHKK